MCRITLYRKNTPNISIDIQAYFDNEKLVIEGYDIGKIVGEAWGDSDYEYKTTIPGDEVKKPYSLMNVPDGDNDALLKTIAKTFNTNTCYSQFNDFLEKNGIKSEGFSWT